MITYVQNNQCEATQIEDEWIILDTENFKITKINDVGGYCWSLLTQPQSLDTLTTAVTENYGADEKETVQHDLEQFLAQMLNCGLIQHAR